MNAGGGTMKSLFIPWTLAQYLNGAHPLILSVLDGLAGQVMIAGPQANATVDLSDFAEDYGRLADELRVLTDVDRDTAQRFIATRYHLSDALAPPNSIAFHHTILPSLRHSSIVHFETPILFFWPEASHGKFSRDSSLVDHPFYPLISASLAHANVKKIVSHSTTGLRYLRGLFPNQVIQDKTAHIPLMPFVQRSVERARQLPGGRPVPPTMGWRRLLFTNSFHGEPSSFWVRGGVTTLLAFQRVGEEIPLELVIVGSIPDDLPQEVADILRSPYVRHIPSAAESELQAYYDSADVMLLPSVGLHENSHLDAPPGRAGMKNACCRRQQESGRVVAWPSGEAATVCTTPATIWSGLPSIGNGCCRGRFGSECGSCFARLPRIMDLRWRNWRSTRIMSICF